MASPPVQRARTLRKQMTPPELTLWQHLRALRAEGWHFRRQSPEPPYTLDFVCRRAKLVVEVDGLYHASAEQSELDKSRDQALAKLGLRTMRIGAEDIQTNIDGVMQMIRAELGALQPMPLATKPVQLAGGRRYRGLVRLGLRRRGP